MTSAVKNLPPDSQEVFDALWQEVVGLHTRWIIFKQLYATDENRVALLNKVAGTFFAHLQGILIDDIILCLSRLTDPPQFGKRENLALEQLIEKLDPAKHSPLAASLKQQLQNLQEVCKPFRQNRNRRIAHSDLDTVLVAETSRGILYDTTAEAVERIGRYMNTYVAHFQDVSKTAFDQVWLKDDSNSLVSALEAATKYWAEQRN